MKMIIIIVNGDIALVPIRGRRLMLIF